MVKGFTKKTKSVRASADALKAISGNKKYNDEKTVAKEEPKAVKAKVPALKEAVAEVQKPAREEVAKAEQNELFGNPVVKSEPVKAKEIILKRAVAPKKEAKPKKEELIKAPITSEKNSKDTVVPIKTATEKKEQNFKKSKPELVSDNIKLGLHICNLGKSYGGKPAVRDISMVVNRGEAVGLLGPNGAGKTTSFYMTMGLIKPDYGNIFLDGVDITHLPVYRRARMGIGYLPQEASIFRGMSVEENILAVLELSEPVADKRMMALESLLGEFSITHLRRSPAMALSGGERRRVEIARALASNPSFILLDEPLAGIDPVAVADIKELISHLKNRGIGVLITDHNVREALDLIDRAYIIHDGIVLMEGTPKEIVNNKEVRRVYLGEKFVL
jgi:lipopolysaccharide export system ATP-binding protein